jgi:hypothetical protein
MRYAMCNLRYAIDGSFAESGPCAARRLASQSLRSSKDQSPSIKQAPITKLQCSAIRPIHRSTDSPTSNCPAPCRSRLVASLALVIVPAPSPLRPTPSPLRPIPFLPRPLRPPSRELHFSWRRTVGNGATLAGRSTYRRNGRARMRNSAQYAPFPRNGAKEAGAFAKWFAPTSGRAQGAPLSELAGGFSGAGRPGAPPGQGWW